MPLDCTMYEKICTHNCFSLCQLWRQAEPRMNMNFSYHSREVCQCADQRVGQDDQRTETEIMINKTNFMAVAIIAAAAFTAAPAANATVAAGMSAATAASTTAATTTAPAGIVLAHGYVGRGHGGWGGGNWGHGGHGYRRCRWLKRKARRTGRRYWWHRYYRCRNRY
jgi:hypothetical protein